jgi:hypothetical protein
VQAQESCRHWLPRLLVLLLVMRMLFLQLTGLAGLLVGWFFTRLHQSLPAYTPAHRARPSLPAPLPAGASWA